MPDWQTIEWARKQAQERARLTRAQEAPVEESPDTSAVTQTVQTLEEPVVIDRDRDLNVVNAKPVDNDGWLENLVEEFLGPDKDEIRREQQQLSEMGLYVSEGHRYYNDGIAGALTEHARNLRDDENYGLRYLEQRLSDERYLGSISGEGHEREVLMLESAINHSRRLQGLQPLPVDGVLDADMLAAVQFYKNDYEVETKTLGDRVNDFVQDLTTVRPAIVVEREEQERAARPDTPMNDRQERVTGIMGAAADRFNIPVELMVGIWHHETRFSCSRLTSDTGCQGDWQFERATMRNVVRLYGDDMEAVLREAGQDSMADAVANVQHRLLHGQQVSSQELDAFRNSPEISTVAAAALMRDNAGSLRLGETIEQNEYGIIYAGYNGGLENARRMRDGGVITDPEFLRHNTVGDVARTHAEQRAHYDEAMRDGIREGRSLIAAADQSHDGEFQRPARVRDEGPAVAERVQLPNRFNAAAEGIDFNDVFRQGAQLLQQGQQMLEDGIENFQGAMRSAARLTTQTFG